ncbi:hypothetical protein [Thermoflexus sp.]|uniref:hypothetical protein n=1 Tax=Thermoflexus sp. TaxID=1969742 RepID=UPI0025DF6008|nr:hypothetical protein [Thermoflexus sp.]MCS7351225.1 hypothetical protein [Thermoflexus sp.]MCX7690970.1 hypothetical protein [Thermoflexus sp.]MDW8180679.1 hypothetical protein [Anaerolineae bacterium]
MQRSNPMQRLQEGVARVPALPVLVALTLSAAVGSIIAGVGLEGLRVEEVLPRALSSAVGAAIGGTLFYFLILRRIRKPTNGSLPHS